MQASSLLTLLAAGASVFAAYEVEGTTTSTSTMTQTVTITRCNPSYTNCPAHNSTSSSMWYPTSNSTVSTGPTAYPNTTTYITSSSAPVYPTTVVPVTPSKPAATFSTVPTSGSSNIFVQSGLLLGVLGAGVAMLL